MLYECPDCHHEVSDQAASCPNCGRPLKEKPRFNKLEKKIMRFFVWFSLAVLVLGILIYANEDFYFKYCQKQLGQLFAVWIGGAVVACAALLYTSGKKS